MFSKTPDIISIPATFRREILKKAELSLLKDKTLMLLEDVGVHFPSRKALEILSDHGADVDLESEVVRFPADLVKKALSSAPNSASGWNQVLPIHGWHRCACDRSHHQEEQGIL